MFLIDAVGAFVSIILLALVLPALESVIGMPYRVLYLLAMIAAVLFVFSAFCSLLVRDRWRPFLVAVALSNLLYCVITSAAIVWFRGDLTLFGKFYFVGEVAVIVSLAVFEMLYVGKRSNI